MPPKSIQCQTIHGSDQCRENNTIYYQCMSEDKENTYDYYDCTIGDTFRDSACRMTSRNETKPIIWMKTAPPTKSKNIPVHDNDHRYFLFYESPADLATQI